MVCTACPVHIEKVVTQSPAAAYIVSVIALKFAWQSATYYTHKSHHYFRLCCLSATTRPSVIT